MQLCGVEQSYAALRRTPMKLCGARQPHDSLLQARGDRARAGP